MAGGRWPAASGQQLVASGQALVNLKNVSNRLGGLGNTRENFSWGALQAVSDSIQDSHVTRYLIRIINVHMFDLVDRALGVDGLDWDILYTAPLVTRAARVAATGEIVWFNLNGPT